MVSFHIGITRRFSCRISEKSVFDRECADCLAQYATAKETPIAKWDDVSSKLSKLSTSRLHYVKVPENHIVIDFDIQDKYGKKVIENATWQEIEKQRLL